MTKSTITREQLEEWVAQLDEDGGCDATDRQLEALIRQSLAEMDGEPVAEVVSIYGDPEAFGEREIRPLVGIQQMPYGTKLYRHAQPVPECEQLAIENFRSAMEGIGHIRRTLEETFGGLHGTHVEPDVLAECKAICDAIYAAYGHAASADSGLCTLGDSPYDVPYSMPSNLREFIDQEIGILFSDDDAQGVWIACRRAAMLNGGKP
ncbi:hypothetical protein VAJ56_03115 [Klebsiella pneumoniae]